MLSIRFVDGYAPENWGGYACDFLIEQTGDTVPKVGGLALTGFYNAIPWLRFADIYVVRQPTVWATLKVLVHELTHAAIWLLYLPAKWGKALDSKSGNAKEKR
jgi:hypothetical protein